MNKKELNISNELIQNMSIEDISELKVEMDDLFTTLDNILQTCDKALNT